MYSDQYDSVPSFDSSRPSQSTFRFNDPYYLESLPYSSYHPNSYSFRSQTHPHSTYSSAQPDVISYPNYDPTYLNVAVAAAYQPPYQYSTLSDSIDISFPRHINSLYNNPSEEQLVETSTTTPSVRKRKLNEETMKSQYESELCRVCDDVSSGYHFGVFTCEACKGFFRRYSKKSTILEPCPVRCSMNKNNRNNCAACRFDKCKCVGMALDKIRFGKPPKVFRSSPSSSSSVKLEPTNHDFELMLKLLECYQSFEEYEQHPTTNHQSSVIFQFCHRLANIVMQENECLPETFLARLKRHEMAVKFLITGENDRNLSSWSREPQAWIFAHNERWRLLMILLILAFDDEHIGGEPFDGSEENLFQATNGIERILRLFELEYDQEKQTRLAATDEKNIKYMKAQFVLRFVDMMTNDMIANRMDGSTNYPYSISDSQIYRTTTEMMYLPCNHEDTANSDI